MEAKKQNTKTNEQDSESRKSIIDTIIEESQAVLTQTMQIPADIKAAGITPKMVTTQLFFAETEDERFVTKPAFLAHVRGLSRNQLIAFSKLLDDLNLSRKIDCPFEKLDKFGKPYIWINDKHEFGDRSYKVLTVGKLWDLVELYQFGIFRCSFSLESLYQEALTSEVTNPGE